MELLAMARTKLEKKQEILRKLIIEKIKLYNWEPYEEEYRKIFRITDLWESHRNK